MEAAASEAPICSVDSSCFIEWLMPENERHHPKEVVAGVRGIVMETMAGKRVMILSAFALAEVQKPTGAAREKFLRVLREQNARVHPLDAPLAMSAAEMGNRLGIKGGDAVLLATAIAVGARAFYTLDRKLLGLDIAGVYLLDDAGQVMRPSGGFRIVKPGAE